jgi:hypothetical protein
MRHAVEPLPVAVKWRQVPAQSIGEKEIIEDTRTAEARRSFSGMMNLFPSQDKTATTSSHGVLFPYGVATCRGLRPCVLI